MKSIYMNLKLSQMAAAVFAVFLCSCSGGKNENDYHRTVRTMHPAAASAINQRHFSGMVSEANEISLGFKTAGQIEHVYVKEGDYVRKGSMLASLDDEDYKVGAEGLRAQAAQLKSEFERTKKLFEQKSVSLNDYEKIKAACVQVESQLKSVENKLAYTKLYAPVSGYIKSVNFSKAEMVDAGTPVFELMDDSAREIVVDIPAGLYNSIERIAEVRTQSSAGGAEIPVQILSVIPKADSNQLFRMKLTPSASSGSSLTPGMNVDVEILLNDADDSDGRTLIPARAVVRKGDDTFVWVVGNDSIIKKQNIVIGGMNADGRVTVVDGLSGDENVVTSGVNMIREGEKVMILQQPTKTNVGGLL